MNLIPINITIGDIVVKDISYEELPQLHKLLNEANETKTVLGNEENFLLEEIKERYLESLSSVSDFFLGVYLGKDIIGIIKGRFENRSYTEVWFLTYIIGEKHRKKGFGSTILKEVESWLSLNYSIFRFCVLTYEGSSKLMDFWAGNGYDLLRKTRIKHEEGPVVILEKIVDN